MLSLPAGESLDSSAGFDVDLDGDGSVDHVTLLYERLTRMVFIQVQTHTGRTLLPFAGQFDPKRDRLTLTTRSGGGDYRCRLWKPGQGCGFPLHSHDLPDVALYVTDSRRGGFVLYIPRGYGKDANPTGGFKVVPALDGDPAPAL